MRTCPKCRHPKDPEKDFNWRSKKKGTRQSICRQCQRKVNLKGYYDNPKPFRLRTLAKRHESRKRVFEILQGKSCVDCGENDLVVLDWDHVRGKKLAGIARMIMNGHSWAKIQLEMLKCEVRCANCHRRKTAREQGWVKLRAKAEVAGRIPNPLPSGFDSY